MYRIPSLISFLIIFTTILSAQTVSVLPSIKDNSMFSESGSKSLGAGKLFTGQTCQGNNRRALMQFDLSAIPTDAVVTSVTLNLGAENSGNNGDGVLEIYGVTKAWGEGFSSGSGNGGPAVAPDATWTDAMFGTEVWDTPGGDFDPEVLSARFTDENFQLISFPSTSNFVAQAQEWVENPNTNHGIILIGVENNTCSAYRFGARDVGISPELVVTWEDGSCTPTSTDLTVENCGPFTSAGGFTYDVSGNYTEVYSGFLGCDSIINYDLTIFLIRESFIVNTLCAEETFTLEGNVYDVNNPTGTILYQTQDGCDSTLNIDLTFLPNNETFLNEIICNNEDFFLTVDGTIYDINNPSGIELLENASAAGCDSTININLVFSTDNVGEEIYFGCENDGYSVVVNGTLYDENQSSGTEIILGGSLDGCDSTINITLIFQGLSEENITYSGCEGDGFSVEVDGEIYDEMNSNGSILLVSSNGCDSMVNIDLFFAPRPNPGTAVMPGAVCNENDAILDLNSLLSGADAGGIWTETSPNPSTGFSGNEFDGMGQNPGTYFFRYTVVALNCPDEFTQVMVNVQTPITATVTPTGSVCNNSENGNSSIFNFDPLITAGFMEGIWLDNDAVGVNLSDPSSVDFAGIPVGNWTFTYLTSVIGNCPEQNYAVTIFVEDCTCPSVTSEETFSTCDLSAPATTTEIIANGAFNGCDSIIITTTIYLDSDETDLFITSCNPADTGAVETIFSNQNGCDSVVTIFTELVPLDNSVTVSDATIVATIFGATYQWIDCDNNNTPIMGATDRFFMATVSGNYAVEIMEDGCMVTSECVMVTVVNTDEVWFADQIDVLPNPTSGAIRLTFGELENVNLRIMEVTGKVVLEQTNLGGGSADLFLEGAAGLYFVGVEVEGVWGWMKVVKGF